MLRFLAGSFAAGVGGALAIIGVVFATGQTFGQRCKAAYAEPIEVELCVERLSAGGPIITNKDG